MAEDPFQGDVLHLKGKEWLGHANIATTRLYDRRKTRPQDSPTYRVDYFKRTSSMGVGKE